jgi:hypothetical protein
MDSAAKATKFVAWVGKATMLFVVIAINVHPQENAKVQNTLIEFGTS